eukprot:GEZU01021819.1.p1 GENE.GEZU01021819.1~~GEZU01021819.1.p1  ORF type:complete len:336 (+),score=91.71 GEZU01021819.1:156-1163(+)
MAMGYEKKYCLMALEKNGDNLQSATAWLLDNIDKLRKASRNNTSNNNNSSFSITNLLRRVGGGGGGKMKDEARESLRTMIQKKHIQLALATALHSEGMKIEKAVEKFLDAGGHIDGLTQLSSTYKYSSNNFILEIFTYLIRRTHDVLGHCMICDEAVLSLAGGVSVNDEVDLSKPIICTKGTCQFNYQELGVCQSVPVCVCPCSISEDIINNPNVVDLLISMCVASATSSRRDLIFEPYPSEFKDSTGKRDYSALDRILNLIPSVDDMMAHCESETELVMFLNRHDPSNAVYRLLRWILTTNRAALLKMPPKKQIKEMNTPHQYMVWVPSLRKHR